MASELRIGSVFTQKYRVIRRLGAGGMGAVYEAEHLSARRRVALKVMKPRASRSAALRERFHREAYITAGIRSEHVVRVLDAGLDEKTETPYLVMELLNGTDLGRLLKKKRTFSSEDALRYLHQTALALDAMKGQLVHRDLKPSNLFLARARGREPFIKLLDFGVAKVLDSTSNEHSVTAVLGTPMYMSPEQSRGVGVLHTSDVYALGLIAYTFLTGQPYWAPEWDRRESTRSFMLIASHGPRQKASARARRGAGISLPPAFDGWFARAAARLPEDRFSTALEAVGALADMLGLTRPLTAAPAPASVRDDEMAEIPAPEPAVTGDTAPRTTTAGMDG